MINKLTTKNFWITNADGYEFRRHAKGHGIDVFIEKYIPKNDQGTCIEIGSFPGPHLATFGDLGYTLNGIDYHPLNQVALPEWLKKQGFKTCEFITTDFFKFSTGKKYDVVASFGFIEHFVDYKDVILRHAALVNNKGYLIITTPNFKGSIQYWLHKHFDKENLAKHNVPSMDPTEWKNLLLENGFEILYHGYFGGFWFWHGQENLPNWKRKILWFIDRTIPRIRKILWFQSHSFSAYAGIVAKKNI